MTAAIHAAAAPGGVTMTMTTHASTHRVAAGMAGVTAIPRAIPRPATAAGRNAGHAAAGAMPTTTTIVVAHRRAVAITAAGMAIRRATPRPASAAGNTAEPVA